MPVIGLLNGTTSEAIASSIAAVRRGLQDVGFVEGRNLSIEVRAANGQYERLPALAADLVHRRVAEIIAIGGPPPAAARLCRRLSLLAAERLGLIITGIQPATAPQVTMASIAILKGASIMKGDAGILGETATE